LPDENDPLDYDHQTVSLRESVLLAIEAAKVGQVMGAQQVIGNFRKKYDEDLVPKDLDFPEPIIPSDAIPFHLTYADGDREAGMPLPNMDIDPQDGIILENFGTLRQWGREWVANLGGNASLIHEDHARRGSLIQAHTLNLSHVKDPTQAVVCGSGASLEDLKSLLPAFPGVVLCGASNASTVLAAGRKPDAILSLDAGSATVDHLKECPYDEMGIPLITSTIMHPDVPRLFPNTRKWFTSLIQMGAGANHPFNVFSQLMFPFINSYMFQAGCTINGELLLLNMMEEMSYAKFDAVYLLGVDFCYKKEAPRCKAYKYVNDPDDPDDPSFVELPPNTKNGVPTTIPIRRSWNGLITDQVMLEYKRSLLTLWVITKLPFYDCSSGILTEVPRADFEELAKTGFRARPPLYDYQYILSAYNAYLTRLGYVPGKDAGSEGEPLDDLLW
jgi:hypothetical protein